MGARATGWVQYGQEIEIAGKFGKIIHAEAFGRPHLGSSIGKSFCFVLN